MQTTPHAALGEDTAARKFTRRRQRAKTIWRSRLVHSKLFHETESLIALVDKVDSQKNAKIGTVIEQQTEGESHSCGRDAKTVFVVTRLLLGGGRLSADLNSPGSAVASWLTGALQPFCLFSWSFAVPPAFRLEEG
jgi:hypothetical protein